MKSPINVRQQAFVRKHVIELKPANVAYAEAYNREVDETARVEASRLLSIPTIQREIEDLAPMFKEDAVRAYEITKEIMEDKMTPAAVRVQTARDIMDRAGYGATQKTENKTTTTFKGITDISKDELRDMLK